MILDTNDYYHANNKSLFWAVVALASKSGGGGEREGRGENILGAGEVKKMHVKQKSYIFAIFTLIWSNLVSF